MTEQSALKSTEPRNQTTLCAADERGGKFQSLSSCKFRESLVAQNRKMLESNLRKCSIGGLKVSKSGACSFRYCEIDFAMSVRHDGKSIFFQCRIYKIDEGLQNSPWYEGIPERVQESLKGKRVNVSRTEVGTVGITQETSSSYLHSTKQDLFNIRLENFLSAAIAVQGKINAPQSKKKNRFVRKTFSTRAA